MKGRQMLMRGAVAPPPGFGFSFFCFWVLKRETSLKLWESGKRLFVLFSTFPQLL